MSDQLAAIGVKPFREDSFAHIILGDVVHARLRLDEADTAIHRREMVRASFSAIEGLFFLMKRSLSEHPDAERVFSIHERAALLEETFQVGRGGRVTPQIRFSPLPNTYKLIVALAERIYPDYSDDTMTPSSWSCFLKALDVRNRLTHPKKLSDLQVSRKDSNFCYATFLRILALAVEILHLDRQKAWAGVDNIPPIVNDV